MTHQQVRFHLTHRIQHHADRNQQTGSAEERSHQGGHVKLPVHHRGNHGNHRQENGSGKSDFRHRIVEKFRRWCAGTDTRHITAVFFQIISNLHRLELSCLLYTSDAADE